MIYNKIKILIVLVILLDNFNLKAQYDFSTDFEVFIKAKESLYLFKNEYSKIPIKGPDIINAKHYYSGTLSNLPASMELYFSIENQEIDLIDFKDNIFDQSSLNILSLDLESKQFGKEVIKNFEEVIEKENTITILFDSENNIGNFPLNFSKCSHLIYVRGSSALHQSLAVQLLFGGVGTQQKLEEDLSSFFKKGNGFSLPGDLRLGYAPPEAQGLDGKVLEGISSIAQSAIDSGAFPGCQVLVVKDQKVVFHQAWGYHTYDQKQKVQLNDIYDFASLTKVTSALPALMKLQGEGKLGLDDPLKKYFPKFKNSNKADLSIRAILAHNAKLKPWIPYWRSTLKKNGKFKWRTFKKHKSRRFPIEISDELYLHYKYKKRIYKAIKKSPLNEEPGYVYSGLIFYLWPEIVSDMVGEDFETYLKKTFYEPLGASTITYNPKNHFPLDRIIPTENDTFFRKVQIHGKVHDEGAVMMAGVSANAGLFADANDLAKLMQMYLNGGTYGGQRFIEESAVKEFTRCQYCDEGNHRGLGFDKPLIEYDAQASSVAKDASAASFGHSGYTGTFAWVDPEYNLIYIFFSNRVFPTRENRKIYELNVRPRIHQLIYDSFLIK
jgi:CubicO group peptidase (beta-lactamase class C family)